MDKCKSKIRFVYFTFDHRVCRTVSFSRQQRNEIHVDIKFCRKIRLTYFKIIQLYYCMHVHDNLNVQSFFSTILGKGGYVKTFLISLVIPHKSTKNVFPTKIIIFSYCFAQ